MYDTLHGWYIETGDAVKASAMEVRKNAVRGLVADGEWDSHDIEDQLADFGGTLVVSAESTSNPQ